MRQKHEHSDETKFGSGGVLLTLRAARAAEQQEWELGRSVRRFHEFNDTS